MPKWSSSVVDGFWGMTRDLELGYWSYSRFCFEENTNQNTEASSALEKCQEPVFNPRRENWKQKEKLAKRKYLILLFEANIWNQIHL